MTDTDDASPGTAPNTRGWAVGVYRDQDLDGSRPATSVTHHHPLTRIQAAPKARKDGVVGRDEHSHAVINL